ncbi:MAG: hypothetical protein AB1648_08675 [Pseudomonadota bacterium]
MAGLGAVPAWAAALPAIPGELIGAVEASRLSIEPAENGHHRAENPDNRLRIDFGKARLTVSSSTAGESWRLGLRLTGYGTSDRAGPVAPASLKVKGNRIEFRRGPLTEWYENRTEGLEQGFTLAQPPEGGADSAVVRLAVEGGLKPTLAGDGQSVVFSTPDGRAILSYRDLKVVDAEGRVLPAHIVLAGNTLGIDFDTRGAAWPVVVDPLVKSATAFASDGSGTDRFGFSVAVSGDTAVIGAPTDNFGGGSNRGTVDVFLRTGGVWARQQDHLVPTSRNNSEYFGYAVAVHGDTLLVGAPRFSSSKGRVVVFTRSGSSWSQQQVLIAGDAANSDFFGASVAVYGDTAVIGAPGDDNTQTNQGSVYVFTRSGTTWTQVAKKYQTAVAANSYFGGAVSLSGNRLLAGAAGAVRPLLSGSSSTTLTGQAEVFTGSGASWTSEGTLPASGLAAQDRFGWSVALYQLNGDPIEALVGAPYHNSGATQSGAAYAFVRSGGAWSQQAKLQKTTPVASDLFGYAVALSEETAVVGVPFDDTGATNAGVAYVFSHGSGSTWVNQQTLVLGDASGFTAASNNLFGWAVALTGNAAVIGVSGRTSSRGAASFYTFPCAFGRSYVTSQWTAISVPCQAASAIANVGGLFGEGNTGNSRFLNSAFQSTGTFAPGNWTVWQRNPLQVSNSNTRLTALTDGIGSGNAYWLLSQTAPTSNGPIGAPTPNTPESTATPVTTGNPRCVSSNGCYEMTLVAGDGQYNNLGFPLPYDVDWADVRLQVENPAGTFTGYTPSGAQTANFMSSQFWVWNGGSYQTFDDAATPGTLRVMRSFYVKMLAGSTGAVSLKLLIPAKPTLKTSARAAGMPWYLAWLDRLIPPAAAGEADAAVGLSEREAKRASMAAAAKRGKAWRIRLSVENQALTLADPGNWLGELPGSLPGYDPTDLREIAPAASPWLSIVFPHPDWGEAAGAYATDYRAMGATSPQEKTWQFEIRSDASQIGQSVYLGWEGERRTLKRCVLTDGASGQKYRLGSRNYRQGLTVFMADKVQPFSLFCSR